MWDNGKRRAGGRCDKGSFKLHITTGKEKPQKAKRFRTQKATLGLPACLGLCTGGIQSHRQRHGRRQRALEQHFTGILSNVTWSIKQALTLLKSGIIQCVQSFFIE